MLEKNRKDNAGKTDLPFDGRDLLCGENGAVWATYELKQAKIIQSALLAQNIHSEIDRITSGEKEVILIRVTNQADVNEAIDFIWKSRNGLRLKPDWSYAAGQRNKSFERWLGGNLK